MEWRLLCVPCVSLVSDGGGQEQEEEVWRGRGRDTAATQQEEQDR